MSFAILSSKMLAISHINAVNILQKMVFFLFLLLLPVQSGLFAQQKKLPVFIYGTVSFYSDRFNGRRTASGEVFSQKKMTCASNKYPFGTWLRITNPKNGKWVLVRVNDRLHAKMKRIADLTRSAAAQIGIIGMGTARVKVENMGKKKPVFK